MTTRLDESLRAARALLAATSDSPDLDARRLLEHVLGVTASHLIVHGADPLNAADAARFDALVARRSAGEPVAYLTGRVGFWTLDLAVDSRVLIPRPDTETLVEAVLDRLDARTPLNVVDLGTGSGAIALALASERPTWRLTATDASSAALACAQANATRLGVANTAFSAGAWYAAIAGRRFDAIVSNPPYIASGDTHLAAPELTHEPQNALVAADHGIADLDTIIAGAPAHLNSSGAIFVEHGADQGEAVRALLAAAGFVGVASIQDLGRNERVSTGRLAG
ncbi:peptide chain release factor N(5)-glutamine methyltransferase [Salinisphaera aquimarina]|uniref:Release factor glutamine methyltransferase n=1 Tax=Salinisphaera aquimarina TaxID=2094031 RepID=A0ABV7ELM6_9GAMM